MNGLPAPCLCVLPGTRAAPRSGARCVLRSCDHCLLLIGQSVISSDIIAYSTCEICE
ncbi:unnamed protein product [Staurois parvus]|uniref:Uncharacterized protein n=1 Tax=Staurois parvus TaxID=386267 RepID=A0ABN9GFW5_9NEOB|nr:unnamed protein product [Staurois parvus]